MQQSKERLIDSKRFSVEAIHADYKMLESQINRFITKLEKGLSIKEPRLPFESKHKKKLAEAHEYLK